MITVRKQVKNNQRIFQDRERIGLSMAVLLKTCFRDKRDLKVFETKFTL